MKSQLSPAKKRIIERFYREVKGRTPSTGHYNLKHSGKAGHWLETQMGKAHDASNSPDIDGYEMKNNTNSKTSFGDWSADYYIYRDKRYGISRDDFIRIFGKPNPSKGGRCSWSGEPCPKIGGFNSFGQKLRVDDQNNIYALYAYSEDKRVDKDQVVPEVFQGPELVIAKWEANSIKKKLEDKFNQKGWFKCMCDETGAYNKIVFGDPVNFSNWIKQVKLGVIILDSGMYQGNSRNYSMWRANNSFWNNLITTEY